ncbi:MAG: acetyl/propionyl/methylcrotonyl-CoA carboxylase subunit alpha [Alphaproteobacteria bacterium]|nr:acetyl/propionyl/methylcrotonyl-CoA carboxylase subunit alpha [Alphaproteobacteria bacterium]
MLESLLIANRGEIACRVIRTARAMGIRTIAVYSDADAGALHVEMADEAVHIGPSAAAASYLNIPAIIAAARRTGASAIHPGYGFLSENPLFAEACASAGIIFVGPPASAMRAMGAKDAAKRLMQDAKVPVVPGYHGDNQDAGFLAEQAKKIGFPVLIKAVAGGGGRGMRRVDSAAEFAGALESAMRESRAAFGDDKVLVERYMAKPRHIEIQVFADSHGNAVHLYERDCSIQRRHQKVIEEAPAPGMPRAMREKMGAAAVQAAKAIGYLGAGTVEFIADASRGLREDSFYFIEMNTRLQVEHPVTEMITGLDLVEWQLRVAMGETLPMVQSQIPLNGHAFEVRLYMENPATGFLPSTGKLRHLRLPAQRDGVRIDTGVREGDEVSIFYDPMIAKLIVHGADRTQARLRLCAALEAVQIAGPAGNVGFLRAIAGHPAFASGDVDTGFIERYQDILIPRSETAADDHVLALACLAVLQTRAQQACVTAAHSGDPYSPWFRTDGWRANATGRETLRFVSNGAETAIAVEYVADGVRLRLPGGEVQASASLANGSLTVELDGRKFSAGINISGMCITVMLAGHAHIVDLHDPVHEAEQDEGVTGDIVAPMPGKLISVLVKAGDSVRKGDALAVLEAMKMENTLVAPVDGIVAEVNYAAGEQVEEGAVIVTFRQPE